MERGFLLLPWCATLCALGAAALAAGCGEPDPVDDRDGSLRLELTEYALDPQVVKTSSRSIRIQARNRGRLTHNVSVQEEREGEGAQARPRAGHHGHARGELPDGLPVAVGVDLHQRVTISVPYSPSVSWLAMVQARR